MPKDFNNPHVIQSYDEHIRKLIPGYELIHLQVNAILKAHLADHIESGSTNILIVGCGTGYELQYLAEQFPQWHFTAIDPALGMLEKAKQHISNLGLENQISFIHSDTTVLHSIDFKFDAALSILVSHFVPQTAKQQFFTDIYHSLKEHGLCISYDLMQIENQKQRETLKLLTQSIGLSQQQSYAMIERLTHDFHLCSIAEMHHFYTQAHFSAVKSFAQVLNYYGFVAIKSKNTVVDHPL